MGTFDVINHLPEDKRYDFAVHCHRKEDTVKYCKNIKYLTYAHIFYKIFMKPNDVFYIFIFCLVYERGRKG